MKKIVLLILIIIIITSGVTYGSDGNYLERFGEVDFEKHVISKLVDDDVIKIVFLGNSVVHGLSLATEDTIPYLVNEKLEKQLQKPVKVYNLAISGGTMFEDYHMYKKSLEYINPDCIC